jgi:hypothetical protein
MSYPQGLSYKPETRVVLVGTTVCPQDKTNLPPLPHVERNIQRLVRLFSDPKIVGLPSECLVEIVDEGEASAISTKIAQAADEATDTLIVYYAGHGLYGDEASSLYLAAKNTTSSGKSFNAVDINNVKRAIRSSAAQKRMLILDCCYSGRAFIGGMSSADLVDNVRPVIDLAGTYGIAAVPADYKALAPPGAQLTKFTQALVDVLEGGIQNDVQVLTAGDVFDAARNQLRREAMPVPEAINWNDGRLFRLAKNQCLTYARETQTSMLKIAMFLDVDLTLTQNYIQSYYAAKLGCYEEYKELQDQLDAERINSEIFGNKLIALFAARKFTEPRAKELYNNVIIYPLAKQLLNMNVDKFLVSSGPSYFIDEFAKEYNIPAKRVLSSRYYFGDDHIIKDCAATNPLNKQFWVEENSKEYDITIGIGDNDREDGGFVNICTIPMLTKPHAGYIHVDNFNSVIVLVNRLLKLRK